MKKRAHIAGIVSAPSVELIHSLASNATAILPSLNRLMQFIEAFMGKLRGQQQSRRDRKRRSCGSD
jgi:hypothetical protein